MSMDVIEAFAETLYEEKICDEYDRIIPIVADESSGKSTFILEFMVLWKRITGQDVNNQEIIDQLVYDLEGFQNALADYPPRTVIPVPDAARALHKKEAMREEQIEAEKDLLDVRIKEHVILLGYQDWDIVPKFLQKRRAKNVFYIPTRGQIWGFNRESIDEKFNEGSWPEPDMTAKFPSLEGTDLWREYKEEDRQRKKERMRANSDERASQSLQDIAEEIKDEGIESVVGIHGGWNRKYIDPDLIQMEWDLSIRDAKKVKKLLERDDDVTVPADG
jgi:hypothetical protein